MKNSKIHRVCVYCGSSPGSEPEFTHDAAVLGKLLAQNNIELVYGGASIGVMGAVANSVLENGGNVTGVIPHGLFKREVAHNSLTKLLVVDSMHERKALMAQLSDAFITLPGGFGTLEELFEMITWTQLGIHQKPIFLLNTLNFYDPLAQFIDGITEKGFIRPTEKKLFTIQSTPQEIVEDILHKHVHDVKNPALNP